VGLLSFTPVLFLLILLFAFGLRLVLAAPLAFLFTAALTHLVWQLPNELLAASVLKGMLLSADILLIIFGAVFFLKFLANSGYLSKVESLLCSLSPDRRVQAIVIAWLFGGFIEGSAGFGTPAAIVAPLLAAIGFPVLTSILVALAANSTSVAFGAVGTPVRIGFAGLDIQNVAWNAALINAVAGLFVPLLILALVVRERPQGRMRSFFEAVPFALAAGLAFLLPSVAVANFGYEFPTLIGAALGLFATGIMVKMGLLVPVKIFRFSGESEKAQSARPRFLPTVFPYLLLIALLVTGKFLFSDRIPLILPGGQVHSFSIFNPGLAFLTGALLLLFLGKAKSRDLFLSAKEAVQPLWRAGVAIFFISTTTQLMILSAEGPRESGMLAHIASTLAPVFPWVSVALGAFGSFMAGSATVSNLIFGPIQAGLAEGGNIALAWVLAMQLVGAGAGNMVALPNILAVQATVGSHDSEAKVLGKLLLPCVLYIVFATLAGLSFSFIF